MVQLDTSWLQHVQKPARYTGGEYNSIVKDHSTVDVTMALAFPDVYEVAMSHLGIKILYGLINRREDAAAERVFAPVSYTHLSAFTIGKTLYINGKSLSIYGKME